VLLDYLLKNYLSQQGGLMLDNTDGYTKQYQSTNSSRFLVTNCGHKEEIQTIHRIGLDAKIKLLCVQEEKNGAF
jgi:hypothetical protein